MALYEGMKITLLEKGKSITFVANVAEEGPTSFRIRVKLDDLSPLHSNLLGLLPSKS